MKKINKKELAEILKEYFWLANYEIITLGEKRIYINTLQFTIVLWYGSKYGWNYYVLGECTYLTSKYSLQLCERLEKSNNYYDNSK